jgi:hypothetical protein
MRRVAISLIVLALAAVACGGGKSSTASSVSAAEVLSGVKTPTGPQKVTADVTIKLDGAPASLGAAAAFLQQPIDLKVSGVTDPTTNAADVDLTIALGALNLPLKLQTDGKHAWLQYQGTWYDLGDLSNVGSIAGAATGTTTPSVNPEQLRQLATEPGKLIKDPKVAGTEDVGGVPTTHVTGTLDISAIMNLAQQAAASAGTTTSPATTSPEVQSTMNEIQQVLKTADVGVWVGQSDKVVHRGQAHIVADTSQVAGAQGLKGATIDVDATTTGTGPVTITPPANPKPIAELEQAVLGALGPALGGSLTTTTG